MEQFKVCEKDTKTKAYSKEGLARASVLDPREAEKEDKRCWINECLEKVCQMKFYLFIFITVCSNY